MMKKLKTQLGETLVETLVAMLIAVMSMALLSTAVLTAANINKANRELDEQYAADLAEAEGQLEAVANTAFKLKINFEYGTPKEIANDELKLYGSGQFISYDYEPADGGGS